VEVDLHTVLVDVVGHDARLAAGHLEGVLGRLLAACRRDLLDAGLHALDVGGVVAGLVGGEAFAAREVRLEQLSRNGLRNALGHHPLNLLLVRELRAAHDLVGFRHHRLTLLGRVDLGRQLVHGVVAVRRHHPRPARVELSRHAPELLFRPLQKFFPPLVDGVAALLHSRDWEVRAASDKRRHQPGPGDEIGHQPLAVSRLVLGQRISRRLPLLVVGAGHHLRDPPLDGLDVLDVSLLLLLAATLWRVARAGVGRHRDAHRDLARRHLDERHLAGLGLAVIGLDPPLRRVLLHPRLLLGAPVLHRGREVGLQLRLVGVDGLAVVLREHLGQRPPRDLPRLAGLVVLDGQRVAVHLLDVVVTTLEPERGALDEVVLVVDARPVLDLVVVAVARGPALRRAHGTRLMYLWPAPFMSCAAKARAP
jgi:hypothetical protein